MITRKYRLLGTNYMGDTKDGLPRMAATFQPVPLEGQTLVDVQGQSATITVDTAEETAQLQPGKIYTISIDIATS
jgi:hypothetical protein